MNYSENNFSVLNRHFFIKTHTKLNRQTPKKYLYLRHPPSVDKQQNYTTIK